MAKIDKTQERPKFRPSITEDDIKSTMAVLQRKIRERLDEKGDGAFASRHEILGILVEEQAELIEAVEKGSLVDVADELLDVAVGAALGLACVRAGKVQW